MTPPKTRALAPLGFAGFLFGLLLFTLPASAQAPDPQAEPLRGDIRERNGVVLATTDNPDRQIVFDVDGLVQAWRVTSSEEFPTYSPQDPGQAQDPAAESSVAMPRMDIARLLGELAVPKLTTENLAAPFNARQARESGHWRRVGNSWKTTKPGEKFVYRRFLSEEEFRNAEAIKAQIPGMETRVLKSRRYPLGALAAHTVGYVNEADAVLRSREEKIGVMGAEKAWNERLAPKVRDGRPVHRGDDVYLTLDARHQMIVERALRESGIGRGTAVLLRVDSGDVFAMASVPSFDPADFVPSLTAEKYDAYVSDKTLPMFDRCQGTYAPGAAFLPVTCLAAIMSGHENLVCECRGTMELGSKTLRCWTDSPGHGHLEMDRGLETSCNICFYQLGIAAGMEQLTATASLLGLGKKSGIGLPDDAAGLFPDPVAIAQKEKRSWTDASTANTAIGQGYVLTTPVQMAVVISTIANGSTVWPPRLLDRSVSSSDGSISVPPKIRSADLREHGLTDQGLALIQRGLFANVHGAHGTGTKAASREIAIAGHTGTSQYWREDGEKDNRVCFICYAPVEKPRWALVVLVEGGKSGGSVAAPIARRILEQIAALEAGKLKVELKPLAPAKGHFNFLEQVSFADGAPGE